MSARVGEPVTMRPLDDAADLVSGVAFPAAREDLLLQAIVSHATPALIGELRALPDRLFPDARAVLDALAAS